MSNASEDLPEPERPVIEEKWFGKGQRTKEDESVRPFKVNVDDKVKDFIKKSVNRIYQVQKLQATIRNATTVNKVML